MTDRRIYHVADRTHWTEARATGHYARSTRDLSFDEVGFVHCANAEQVEGVLDRFYQGVDDLVLLTIDASVVADVLRDEHAEGDTEDFPHLYRPLPVGAVVEVTDLGDPADLDLT